MSTKKTGRNSWRLTLLAIALAASSAAFGTDVPVRLSGDQEVPPVSTPASGTGTITVGDDRSVSGSISTIGIAGTAAHIHQAPAGKEGNVIIPLVRGAEGTWSVAAGAKLTEAQYAAFKNGDLYVNVHSAANPGGEIRGQLLP